MRRALLLTTLVWLTGAAASASSSTDEEPDGGRASSASEAADEATSADEAERSPRRILDAAFRSWQEAARSGDSLRSLEAGQVLRARLDELDVAESEPLAAAVLGEMQRRLQEGRPGADRIAQLAVDLAPSFPPAYWGLARARFHTAPLSFGGWLDPMVDAVRAHLRSARHARPLLANLAIALVASLVAAGFMALLVGLARHVRRFAHDLRHLLPGMPPAPIAGAIFFALLSLLAIFVGGPLLWVGIAGVLLSAYLAGQERWALAIFLAAAGQIGIALGWLEAQTTWADAPAAALDAVDARGDFSALPRVRALVDDEEARPEALFVLARHARWSGRLDEAAALYDRALALRGDWPAALVNRANLHFLAGELEEAAAKFERATELDPDLAEAWFGLSRVHYRRVNITQGQSARERALELRPDLAERYNAAEEGSPRHLADAGLAEADLVRLVGPPVRTPAVERFLWGPISPSAAPIAGGILGLLVLLAPLFAPRPSRACPQCGAAICRRCDRGLEESETCSACAQLASRKRGLDPAVRNRKEVEIARYARRQRILLRAGSLLGVGPLLRGESLWGYFLLPLIGVGLAGLLGGPHPPIFGGWPIGLRLVFVIPLLLAVGLSVWIARGKEA